jgi:hypothetical protein
VTIPQRVLKMVQVQILQMAQLIAVAVAVAQQEMM